MIFPFINLLLNNLIRLRMFLVKHTLWSSFIKATRNPQQSQNELLKQILSKNQDTVFGKEHGFEEIKSYKGFCDAVPVQSYENLREYIDKQEEEKNPYLTAEQPVMYAQTSGTTGDPKFISILKSSISQYRKSQQVFAYAVYASISGVYNGKVLGIRSPAVEGYLDTGTPYGSMSGFIYKSMPGLVRSKFVVPTEIFEIEDYELKYYLIAVFSLVEDNITLMATANPSTILKLGNIIGKQSQRLIHDIKTGTLPDLDKLSVDQKKNIEQNFKKNTKRAGRLKNILSEKGNLTFADIWPNLKAVCTWTSGSCRVLIPSLRKQLLPSTNIIEMGYLSSEFRGSITIDVLKNKGIPTLEENFFEFVAEEEWGSETPTFLTLEQIEEDRKYYIFVTTQNGLYRYFINDIVEVNGRYNSTPAIRFTQKGKGVTNITGEKLYENQLVQVMEAIKQEYDLDTSFFIMLADQKRLQYHLYLENESVEELELLNNLEDKLSSLNIEYENKRKSGRLQSLNLKFLKVGAGEAYKKYCIENGQREGQFKVAHLQYKEDCIFDFHQFFKK
ncbi:hypothetical protein CMK22_17545 [Candidatus Poribacteria bacterium]|nr:hypothetical protein [Candidatus Poribacteria bacterium]